MKTKLFSMALAALLVGAPALAQQEMETEQRAEDLTEGVYESPLVMSPRVGVLGYSDPAGEYQGRALGGFSFEWLPSEMLQLGGLNFGIETGILYSHLGAPDSGFLGTSSEGANQAGANSFLVPGNIIVGYELTDSIRLAGLLGANMIYRSVENSMNLGRGADDNVEFFPSAGLNLGFELSNSVALSLRGDYIPTPADDVFTSSLGLTVPLA